MKVAMVSEHASPLAAIGGVDAGGQNVHVAALATALAEHGHAVVVYTRRDDPDLESLVAMATPGTTRHPVTVAHVDAGPAAPIPKDDIYPFVPDLAEGLRRAWAANRPDVVHAHFWMSGLAALDAAIPLGIPVLQTFHALGTVKRRHQGRRDTSPRQRIASEVDIARRADRVVATCSDELFELARMGADVGRVSIVPCGVDTDLFSPETSGGPASGSPGSDSPASGVPPRRQRYRIVSVGRLVERKGVDDIVRALAAIPDTELVVAGGPDADALAADADAGRISDLARSCGVADRVHLVGRLGRDGVPELLRSADLAICVPWYEPFGIVPLEAMSCARPVVASDVGGLSDTVVDGVTGRHVHPRLPGELARTVRALLADPARRAEMGAAGRARVVDRYQWSRVARATVSAYGRARDEAQVGPVDGRARRVALG